MADRSVARPPTVIMISLDGTRPADLVADRLPSLLAVARAGARADALIPVDPTNTFPNHVSLATGVRPEEHRLVNNSFIDPETGPFSRKEPHRFVESEPIWSVAERNGLRTAAYFWVGSEGAWAKGPGPSQTRKFSSRTSEKTKVNRILKWLDEPDPDVRPQLIVAWFHGADHAGHDFGPDAPEVAEALRPQDVQIARLVREMETRHLFDSTTLIFVSDHGMTLAQKRISLQEELSRAGLRLSVRGIGGFSTVNMSDKQRTPARLDRAVRVIRGLGLEAWRREQAPPEWHVDDPRFGHIVVRAPIGTAIVGRSTDAIGLHGYASEEPSMAAILVARGRGIVPGTKLGRISSLAVAPTVLRLLGLPIPPQMKSAPIELLLPPELRPVSPSEKRKKS